MLLKAWAIFHTLGTFPARTHTPQTILQVVMPQSRGCNVDPHDALGKQLEKLIVLSAGALHLLHHLKGEQENLVEENVVIKEINTEQAGTIRAQKRRIEILEAELSDMSKRLKDAK